MAAEVKKRNQCAGAISRGEIKLLRRSNCEYRAQPCRLRILVSLRGGAKMSRATWQSLRIHGVRKCPYASPFASGAEIGGVPGDLRSAFKPSLKCAKLGISCARVQLGMIICHPMTGRKSASKMKIVAPAAK